MKWHAYPFANPIHPRRLPLILMALSRGGFPSAPRPSAPILEGALTPSPRCPSGINTPPHHPQCFVDPIGAPLTSVQLILSSSVSSTSPTRHTFSPRTMYSPCGTSDEGSPSSGDRITRSTVDLRTCVGGWVLVAV